MFKIERRENPTWNIHNLDDFNRFNDLNFLDDWHVFDDLDNLGMLFVCMRNLFVHFSEQKFWQPLLLLEKLCVTADDCNGKH